LQQGLRLESGRGSIVSPQSFIEIVASLTPALARRKRRDGVFVIRHRLAEAVTDRSIAFETRARTAVLVLIVLSVTITTARNFVGMLHLVRMPFVDEVLRYDRRFEPLKRALPQGTIVGFVTDATNSSEINRRAQMVSYALSPIAIDRLSERPLVVGDFAGPGAAAQHIGPGLRVRHDFGDGVLLLERIK